MVYIKELKKIEKNINILIESLTDEFTKNETKRLINLGGKRLRPLFLILAAKVGTIDKRCYKAAASLELLHTSSLIHDDVIDHGDVRRGRETTVSVYGREKAISAGGILSLFAMDKIISMENKKVSVAMIDTLEILCLGELKQLNERYNFQTDCYDYITRISRKTASLFALSCTMGAVLSGADKNTTDKLHNIGFNIGCSFQILDDILDIESTKKETGKICGMDIRGGITLPYLLLMKKDPYFKKSVLSITSQSQSSEFDKLLEKVRKSSILDETYNVSNLFLDKALDLLSTLGCPKAEESFTYIINKLYKKIYKKI
jgi:heptaprenyl diphosphate synthase